MKETTRVIEETSIYTYYIIGATWLIWACILPMLSIVHFILVILLSVAEYFLCAHFLPKTRREEVIKEDVSTGDEKIDEMLKTGEMYINELDLVNRAIQDVTMSKSIQHIEELSGSILEQVRKNFENASKIRKFLTYYLPTTIKLLNAYAELEKQSTLSESMLESKKRIEDSIRMIETSFTKLLDALYENTMIDITSDITVFENMMVMDGNLNSGTIKENSHE